MRDLILKAALKIAAKRNGLSKLTRENVAFRANCSPALVSHYHGNMQKLRQTVIEVAISEEILPIIAQAAVIGDKNIPLELKLKALNTL
jgi:AcrR family transcriptional regulator